MKRVITFFLIYMIPVVSMGATTCSRMNLTRCLDSICGINAGANPAARCQYCGSSTAGAPKTSNAMRNVSVGASSKFTLNDKELKAAPTDPGQRYAWATAQCIERVTGCTPDDVSEEYDKLIEQSCRSAGVTAQIAKLQQDLKATKSKAACETDIKTCVRDEKRCGPDWGNCQNDSDFDRVLAECTVDIGGCDEYTADLRVAMNTERVSIFADADKLMNDIVASYQSKRDRYLNDAVAACKENRKHDQCVADMCATHMRDKCQAGRWHEDEIVMANQLCKYQSVACDELLRKTNR